MSEKRCAWAQSDAKMQAYHDTEWGKLKQDDHSLFSFLILEGMQAGLSWQTILNRREALTEAFAQFDFQQLKHYTDEQLDTLLTNPAIIRHRLKVYAVRTNAQAFARVVDEFGSFAQYLWQFFPQGRLINKWQEPSQVPSQSALSEQMSKDLKKRGFKFVGSTIIYSFLQASGYIDDHLITCPYKKGD